jgi:23S rRNA (uracil1939-C5)-methyltransferase
MAMRRNASGRWIAGLHHYDDPSRIFALSDCLITDKRVVGFWRDIMTHAEMFPGSQPLRGSVRITRDGAVFTLVGSMRFPRAGELFDKVPELAALWWENDEGVRRLLHDRRPRHDERSAPAGSFAQVNELVAEELRDHVVARVMFHEPQTVVDAYAGSGDTAVLLAERGVRVTAIELDSDAAHWTAARLPEGSTSQRARVEEALPAALPADAVILNPPRAGVDAKVAEALERTSPQPRAIVYVSCNPATLARDLSRLPSYRIESLVAFDMFPQTAHVETVCELVPAA